DRDDAAEDQVGEEAADERSDDAEHDGADPAHRIRAGYEEPRDRACDEADDDETEDRSDVHEQRPFAREESGLDVHCTCLWPGSSVWSQARSVAVVVCVAPSRFVQVTVSPAFTVSRPGANANLWIVTPRSAPTAG